MEKIVFKDLPSTETPINATNLNKIQNNVEKEINKVLASNAGSHNSIYRGKDITDLFYNGTLSQQISSGTFDDIFIGDYIIGQTSGKKYLVADINYRLGTGDTECTTNHILMIPEKLITNVKMNDTDTTNGGYYGSKMHSTNLNNFKTIIQNDFGASHILTHRIALTNTTTNGKPSKWEWYDSTADLMTECMVFGHSGWEINGYNYGADNTQLALFRLDKSKIVARTDAGMRSWYFLRDIYSSTLFCGVSTNGNSWTYGASYDGNIRPAFLIY